MKILVLTITLLYYCSFCIGKPENAVRVPSSYRNGVKWSLNQQPQYAFLESAETHDDSNVVYILPQTKIGHNVHNYESSPYVSGSSLLQYGTGYSTTQLPILSSTQEYQVPVNAYKPNIPSNQYSIYDYGKNLNSHTYGSNVYKTSPLLLTQQNGQIYPSNGYYPYTTGVFKTSGPSAYGPNYSLKSYQPLQTYKQTPNVYKPEVVANGYSSHQLTGDSSKGYNYPTPSPQYLP